MSSPASSPEDHYRITLEFETYVDLETVGDLADVVAAETDKGHVAAARG